ncbi:MAG: hypothetical protein WCY19_07145 [Candidatus Gastranaerophilaceae bacterium]
MQFTIEEAAKSGNSKGLVMSIPNSLYASKILGTDIEMEPAVFEGTFHKNVIIGLWKNQHPLIHTWLLLSSVSICFLSGLLFIIFQ